MGQGAFRGRDVDQFQALSPEDYEWGVLDNLLIEKLFKGIDENTQVIPVVFRPYVFTYRLERGAQKSDGPPGVLTPLLCFVSLSRSGKLYPSSTPALPRDILEPLEAKTYSIGTVDDLDTFLSKESFRELVCTEGLARLPHVEIVLEWLHQG